MINQLLSDIDAALGPAVASNLLPTDDGWDIYEAYIWALVVEAGKVLGARVRFEDVFGARTAALRFRVSPGTVFPTRSTSNPARYTHAVLSFTGKPEIEVHQGIYVSGRSGFPHECDVAVLSRAEAEACRNSGSAHPRCGKAILTVECKYLSSSPGIKLAREFLGLTVDVSNENRFFVCNGANADTQRFLTHHKRKWSHNTLPANAVVVEELRSLFQRALREYVAAN